MKKEKNRTLAVSIIAMLKLRERGREKRVRSNNEAVTTLPSYMFAVKGLQHLAVNLFIEDRPAIGTRTAAVRLFFLSPTAKFNNVFVLFTRTPEVAFHFNERRRVSRNMLHRSSINSFHFLFSVG